MAKPMHIAVIGAGLMGHGIAQVFAAAGHDVAIHDASATALAGVVERIRGNLRDLGQDTSCADRVTVHAELGSAVRDADFVVEAALENLGLKQAIFCRDRTGGADECDPRQQHLGDPDHGDHGKTRAAPTRHRHALVEPAVPGAAGRGDHDTMDRRRHAVADHALHQAIGKTAVHVKKDVPGFVGNRLQHALWREAISLVERGICDAETVDTVVKASFGRRLAVLGPLENADLVGTDLTLAIHQTVLSDIESRPGPSPLLESMVAEGKLGMKSGEGFYRWTAEQQAKLRRRVLDHLKQARS